MYSEGKTCHQTPSGSVRLGSQCLWSQTEGSLIMPKIEIDYTVLVTDEGEFCLRGGILYQDNVPMPYVDDPQQEFYTLVNEEIDGLDSNDSYIDVRRMIVWED